ncbi:MAG: GntR family transcriptional regulator, N-acetylglucosamine utilization regulator [Streptomycetaceae bacterium]|nr:GntR family transcriptional regulator, N-acetylglucosamine utilization regulator [Streptomycetaceae bacterium]
MPAWAQVQRDLRRQIDQELPTAYQLPTERELSEIYGVSRITIRQALGSLAADGYVERHQGSGTFVADRPEPVQHDFGLSIPWRDRFAAAGQTTRSVHLREEPAEPEPYELTKLLSPEEAATKRVHLKRLHVVDHRAIGITDSWVAHALVPRLSRRTLIDGSLSRTLQEVYGLVPADTNNYLEVGAAGSSEARLLNATLDAPLFVVWSVAHLADGRLLETTRTVWLGSRVRFHYTD